MRVNKGIASRILSTALAVTLCTTSVYVPAYAENNTDSKTYTSVVENDVENINGDGNDGVYYYVKNNDDGTVTKTEYMGEFKTQYIDVANEFDEESVELIDEPTTEVDGSEEEHVTEAATDNAVIDTEDEETSENETDEVTETATEVETEEITLEEISNLTDGVEEEIELQSTKISDALIRGSNTTPVTRVAWLSALLNEFDIHIDTALYGDEYYPDVTEGTSNYDTVMTASVIGLTDVEEGNDFAPNAYCNREYAVFTLNTLLGFDKESDEYTFSEKETVAHPDDIQAAIDRGWFTLSNGSFLPNANITEADKSALIKYAHVICHQFEDGEEEGYEFLSSTINLDELSIEREILSIDDDCNYTYKLTNVPTDVSFVKGTIFGFVEMDIPFAKKVVAVSGSGSQYVVETENAKPEEAFKTLDFSGVSDVALASIIPSEDLEVQYIVGGTENNNYADGEYYDSLDEVVDTDEIDAIEFTQYYTADGKKKIQDPKPYERDFKYVAVSIRLTDLELEFTYRFGEIISVYLTGKMIKEYTVNIDAVDEMGLQPNVEIGVLPLGEFGIITLSVELKWKASVKITEVDNFVIGVECSIATGIRPKFNSYCDSAPRIETDQELSIGLKLQYDFNYFVLSAKLYARTGVAGRHQSVVYGDGQIPVMCENLKMWGYFETGWKVNCDIGPGYKNDGTFHNYNESNSPLRINYHKEDNRAVDECTRAEDFERETKTKLKYYTSRTKSKYATGVFGGESVVKYNFTANSDGTATITGFTGYTTTLDFPSTVMDGDIERVVTRIGNTSCIVPSDKREVVRSIFIPDTVTTIGAYAFDGCKALVNIKFSKNLNIIYYDAFKDCTSLRNVSLPDGLTQLGSGGHSNVFSGCTSLSSIYIPTSLTTVSGQNTFKDTALDASGITFGDNITKIPAQLFYGSNIKKITIPDTVYQIGGYTFKFCEELNEVVIPDSVSIIGDDAFYGCTSLKKVDFPEYLESIGDSAFLNCSSLTEIRLPSRLTTLGSKSGRVFEGCTSVTKIYIPKSLTTVYGIGNDSQGNFVGCKIDGSDITFEEGMASIPNYLLTNTSIKTIEIPATVTKIGYGAFRGCKYLTSVKLSNGLKIIGEDAFYNAALLKTIDIPDTVTSLGSGAFSGCTALTKFPMSENSAISEIGSKTFYKTTNLGEVVFSDHLSKIDMDAFSDSGVTSVTFGSGITKIDQRAFKNCKNLQTVNFDKVVKLNEIGASSFTSCIKLKSVTIPASATYFGVEIFSGCTSLATVVLGAGMTAIPKSMFSGCSALTSIAVPKKVTKINASAFASCVGLTSIYIPESVTSIDTTAFTYKKVVIKGKSGSYAETFANKNGYTFENSENKITDISFTTDRLVIKYGSNTTIPVKVTPADYTEDLNFSLKNGSSGVIQILDASTGKIKPLAVGTEIIVVTGGSITREIEVEVYKPVEEVSVTPSELNLDGGVTYKLTAKVIPSDVNQNIIWSSDNSSIAEVSGDGTVFAKKKGSTIIRATSEADATKYAEIEVNVLNTVNTITYVLNDTVEEPARNSANNPVSYRTGGGNIVLANAFRQGYRFLGWYDADNRAVTTITSEMDGDLTIYAKWGPIPAAETPKIIVTEKENSIPIEVLGAVINATTEVYVDLSCATEASNIYYTIDGTVPSADSVLYNEPISICETTVLKAIAVAETYKNSPVGEWTINISEADDYMGDVTDADIDSAFGGDKSRIPQGIWVSGMDETLSYDGGVKKFNNLRVFDYKTLLVEGKDYAVAYKNNKNAYEISYGEQGFDAKKAPQITIIGKGTYANKVTEYFTIDKIDIEAAEADGSLIISDIQVLYKAGSSAKPVPVVKYNNKALKKTTDFIYEYLDSDNNVLPDIYGKSEHNIRVKGNGNYKGTLIRNVLIIDQSTDGEFLGNAKPSAIPAQNYIKGGYTVEAVGAMLVAAENKFVLKDSKKNALNLGTDYYVREVKNGGMPGKATIIIEAVDGSGYVGSKELTFTIQGIAISKAKIDMQYTSIMYSGKAFEPKPVRIMLTDNKVDYTLVEGEDYYLTYEKNVAAGKAAVVFKGTGKYTGTKKVNFTIVPRTEDIASSDVVLENIASNYPYLKGGVKPVPVVKYTYVDNDEIERTVVLQEGIDYTVAYKNNGKIAAINATDAKGADISPTVVVKFKGNYKGSAEKHFGIETQNIAKTKLTVKDKEVSNKANGWKATIALADTNGKALAKSDYEANSIKYTYTYDTPNVDRVKMNSVDVSAGDEVGAKDLPPAGTYITVTVAGKGSYTGTIQATYRIMAAKTDIAKASAKIVNPTNGKNIYYYTGKEIRPGKSDMIITIGPKATQVTLTPEDYTIVGYSNNIKKGTATVTIKGCGMYGGTCSLKYTISTRSIFDNWFR